MKLDYAIAASALGPSLAFAALAVKLLLEDAKYRAIKDDVVELLSRGDTGRAISVLREVGGWFAGLAMRVIEAHGQASPPDGRSVDLTVRTTHPLGGIEARDPALDPYAHFVGGRTRVYTWAAGVCLLALLFHSVVQGRTADVRLVGTSAVCFLLVVRAVGDQREQMRVRAAGLVDRVRAALKGRPSPTPQATPPDGV